MTTKNRSLWEEVPEWPFHGPLGYLCFRFPSSGCWMSMSGVEQLVGLYGFILLCIWYGGASGSGMLAGGVWGFSSFVFVISIHCIFINPQYLPINMSKLTNPIDKNPQSPPAEQIQNSKTPTLPRLRIPDKEVQRKRVCVRSGTTLS